MIMTKHLQDFLDYYQSLQRPRYAVLVTGEWGVGKTHQVRQCLQESEYCYVSLFGLQTPSEAHSAVFVAYAPKRAKINDVFGSVRQAAKDIGGLISLGGAATDVLNTLIKTQIKPDRTIIFDDLERCKLTVDDMFGVFSHYLEQVGCRVVLLTDEQMLEEKTKKDYTARKEKFVGQTIKVTPQINEAFDGFVLEMMEEQTDFLTRNKPSVIDVFKMSQCKSLRVLRHLVFDLGRLYDCLEPHQKENIPAMTEIVSLFTALGIEFRLGRLKLEDLKNRRSTLRYYEYKRADKRGKEIDPPPIWISDERYPPVDLASELLSDDVLQDMFGRGLFDRERIVRSVSNSSHFITRHQLPAWRRVSGFDTINDDELKRAFEEMEGQFRDRAITCPGEMLHVFSLRLMLSEEGILDRTINVVANECLEYLSDLSTENRIPPRGLSEDWAYELMKSHDGYGYWEKESYKNEFDKIKQELRQKMEASLEATFPTIEAEILKTLSQDGREFYRKLCRWDGHESPYAMIPVLKDIEPSMFVDTWLAAPRSEWSMIKQALEDRLIPRCVADKLKEECRFGLGVLSEMEQRCKALTGFEQLRLRRILPRGLEHLRSEDPSDVSG
jgi:hypothetical protein